MISQVLNSVAFTPAETARSAPVVEPQPQISSSKVELPQQAVKAVANNVDVGTLKKASEQINKFLQQFDHNLEFSVDQDTGKQVVRVIDTQSKEVIRQMPTEEMLAIAKALDKLQGLLIKEKA